MLLMMWRITVITKFYRGYIRLGKNKARIDKRPSRVIPQYKTVGGLFKPEYMMLDFEIVPNNFT